MAHIINERYKTRVIKSIIKFHPLDVLPVSKKKKKKHDTIFGFFLFSNRKVLPFIYDDATQLYSILIQSAIERT